ncbi:DUF4291 domain-containing protein [Ulvibacterium marinum]|uniref:DUF4291 domain-containing protein n=1 Tax=Ulvibacterium marinum TaxID=2419782 RepID=UPI002495454C|nr:DUF4291 domain-containing protein [Ulvibacterium marinum]
MKERDIRAEYDEQDITVYQAYGPTIAIPAIENNNFVSPPFKMTRMTWVKPSFLWMMYRSGWASKEGQEHILKIRIKREGFEWALKHSCISHFDKGIYNSVEEWQSIKERSPVRIQWDPERDLSLTSLKHRAIQIGLSGIAVEKYVNEWIVSIEDITDFSKKVHRLFTNGDLEKAKSMLPIEETYFLNDLLKKTIGAD